MRALLTGKTMIVQFPKFYFKATLDGLREALQQTGACLTKLADGYDPFKLYGQGERRLR